MWRNLQNNKVNFGYCENDVTDRDDMIVHHNMKTAAGNLSVTSLWFLFQNWLINLDQILCGSVTFSGEINMYFWKISNKYFWYFLIYPYRKFAPSDQPPSKMATHHTFSHFFWTTFCKLKINVQVHKVHYTFNKMSACHVWIPFLYSKGAHKWS